MTIKYVDGTFNIAGSVTSGTFVQGETMIQAVTYAVAIYGSGTGPIEVGYQPYPATADNSHTWTGRSSNAVFTPTGVPVANGNDAWDGSQQAYVSGTIGPWATGAHALATMTGDQSGNSLKFKRNSVFWEPLFFGAYGTSGNRFTIEDYGTGAKPAFMQSMNIPSGSLWALAPGRTNTYRILLDPTKYNNGIHEAWQVNFGNGQIIYDHENGSYAWFGYMGQPYRSPSPSTDRPVRTTGELSIVAGGTLYPTGGGSGTTVYLQLSQGNSPANNTSAVLRCSTNGSGAVVSIDAIICGGCSYQNGSIGTVMHPYLNSSTTGKDCVISFTSGGAAQTEADILATVDYWPGSAFMSLVDNYLYMHTMHTPAGWSNHPYIADTNGVNLTVAGKDYWATCSKEGMFANSAVSYVDFKNLSTWRHAGPAFGFANNDGLTPMNHCRLYNHESHHPLGEGVDMYGTYNECYNFQMWFAVDNSLTFFHQGSEVANCLVDGFIIHSTVHDLDGNYNPQWTPIGQLYTVLFQYVGSSTVGPVQNNVLRNVTINGNVQIALCLSGNEPGQIVNTTITNFKLNGVASEYLIKATYDTGTIIDRFDNTGYPNSVANAYRIIRFNNSISPTLTRSKIWVSAVNSSFMILTFCSGTINITNNLFAGSSQTKASVQAILASNMVAGQTLNINNNIFNNWGSVLDTMAGDYPVYVQNNIFSNIGTLLFPAGYTNYHCDYNCGFNVDWWGFWKTFAEMQSEHGIDAHSFLASVQPYETNTFRLKQIIAAASSCVGKGVAGAGGVTHDFNWIKIPQGGKVDTGAFQINRGGGG